MLSKPTSSAQRIKLSLTLLIDKVFPVPGHPQIYRLPAFSCSTQDLQNSNTRLCSLSRQTNSHDGTVATCSASLTALICAGSAWHDQFNSPSGPSTKQPSERMGWLKRKWRGLPRGFHLGFRPRQGRRRAASLRTWATPTAASASRPARSSSWRALQRGERMDDGREQRPSSLHRGDRVEQRILPFRRRRAGIGEGRYAATRRATSAGA